MSTPAGKAGPRRGRPRVQRTAHARRVRAAAARPPGAHVPVPVPHHRRRQREHRPHGTRWRPGWSPSSPGCGWSARSRRGAAGHSEVWMGSDAPILAYMDVDLSTDLDALLPLVAPLMSGHSDLAIGSRLHRDARVVRGTKRELISAVLQPAAARGARGAVQRRAVRLQGDPQATSPPSCCRSSTDPTWFFDTELLVLAERCGLRIHEVPVDWYETPTRGWTSPAPPWTTCAGSGACDGRWPPAPCPWRRSRAASAVAARAAGSADTVGSAASSHGLRAWAWSARWSTKAVHAVAPGARVGADGQPPRPARGRGRQHRDEPALDLRPPRTRAGHTAAPPGTGGLRPDAADDLGRSRAAPPLAAAGAHLAADGGARGGAACSTLVRFVAMRLWIFRGPADDVRAPADDGGPRPTTCGPRPTPPASHWPDVSPARQAPRGRPDTRRRANAAAPGTEEGPRHSVPGPFSVWRRRRDLNPRWAVEPKPH